MALSDGRKSFPIGLAVLIQYRSVTASYSGSQFCSQEYGCTPDAKELAYTSLVRPLLEYATPAWDPFHAKDINKVEMVQRRAARFAKSDYCRITSVSKLLDDLGWSTLSDWRKESRLSMFGKAVNNDNDNEKRLGLTAKADQPDHKKIQYTKNKTDNEAVQKLHTS